MLKGIPYSLPPRLLEKMCAMGHGSELVIADANFPAVDCVEESRIVRSDALSLPDALADVLRLFPLDETTASVVLMRSDGGEPQPSVWRLYESILASEPQARIERIERFAFYERAKRARVIFVTGERAPYANVILRKGTIRD